MATEQITTIPDRPVTTTPVERERHTRVSWGGIFGGAFVALGVWALLYSLGLALGLSSIDAQEGVGGPALFTGIWSIITPLVALFVGGYVAARMSGIVDKMAGALHGAVVWGLTTVVGAFALTMLLGTLVGTAVSAGKSAVSATASAGQGAASQLQQSVDVTANQLLQPVNQRLREAGKPEITAQQMSQALQGAVTMSLREGRLDSEIFTQSLAQNTNLSRQDVQEIASGAEQELNQAASQIQSTAASAAQGMGKAFWGVFFALLLGLASSVLGAVAGVSGLQKHDRRTVVGRPATQVP